MSLDGISVDNQIQLAEQRITHIFLNYLSDNKQNQAWSWYVTAQSELSDFQDFIYQERVKKLNIDDIKQYVLTSAEKFTALLPWALGLDGNSDLKKNLIAEVNRWPTYVELLEKDKASSDLKIDKIRREKAELETEEFKLSRQLEILKKNHASLQAENDFLIQNAATLIKTCQNNFVPSHQSSHQSKSTPINNLTLKLPEHRSLKKPN